MEVVSCVGMGVEVGRGIGVSAGAGATVVHAVRNKMMRRRNLLTMDYIP